ncbi:MULTISPECIES: DUF6360 family protein [Halomicrobium]|uniref:Uncharacterized protein n=2 Tax=Halomicrobium mukohataei TaxID=57705 RepID=C7NXY3_HALMD|nr:MULTISPECIES: DUF6360 family protein [Halomicrobium]ACV46571.1 conserved hypothetical protein [Halomicrobium mukohataei DSM 12286]QCD65111.1 hypothetical protein E5139_05445 [Halomicrobium mukohataei]QFR19917.1 hypothetical protein GBQ70_05440 [Halomicrobium sp. ZPS1]
MVDRIMRVNAYTTFDLLEGRVKGHGFDEDAYAVLNVSTDTREDPDAVEVQIEMDNTEVDAVEPHADTVSLSPAQAREMAAELEKYASKVDASEE